MIAKVRIAPVEQWCESYRNAKPFFPLAGLEIEIFPRSMTERLPAWHTEPCKVWEITSESIRRMCEVIGAEITWKDGQPGLCEHMLELD